MSEKRWRGMARGYYSVGEYLPTMRKTLALMPSMRRGRGRGVWKFIFIVEFVDKKEKFTLMAWVTWGYWITMLYDAKLGMLHVFTNVSMLKVTRIGETIAVIQMS